MNHDILLHRLESSFGIAGSSFKWIKSYLADRVQTVQVNRYRSSKVSLTFGVPQGSVKGPLSFTLYTKDVTAVIQRHGMLDHCYADDTQLYFYCRPDQMSHLADVFSRCVNELKHKTVSMDSV